MQEKLDWTQTNITVDIAIRKDGVPGTVLNLSCAVILFLGSSRPMLILSLDYYILTSVAYSSLKLFSCRQLVLGHSHHFLGEHPLYVRQVPPWDRLHAGKVLDSEAFVSDIYSFHFQGMHELLTPLYFVVKKAIVVTKEAIREEAKSFRRRPIVNLQ